MEINKIITLRNYIGYNDYGLVFEWENIFKEEFNATFFYEKHLFKNRFVYNIPFISHIALPTGNSFVFDMYPRFKDKRWNAKNIIPCIIDYYLDDKEIPKLEKNYNKNPLVLISSRQVYCHLKALDVQLPIAHLPLSLSDKYRINPSTKFEKKYDLVLAGRPNLQLQEYLKQYLQTKPNLLFVYNKKENGQFVYYTSTGDYLGPLNNRQDYINLLYKSKIAFYSTPGIDGDEKRTGNSLWSQVTPRLFEYIANGCHIIARFPKNEDTEFFELDKITLPADNYQVFKQSLDWALNNDVDMNLYSKYLEHHYTSERVKLLKEYLQEI